jgi:hypothetical protein
LIHHRPEAESNLLSDCSLGLDMFSQSSALIEARPQTDGAGMRDQYAGDVSDFLKFALLRVLAGSDRRLGVAWYYVPGDDGRADGRHLEWRGEVGWKALDAVLHAELSALEIRTVAALEFLAIWPPGAIFHNDPMSPKAERAEWCRRKREILEPADLVFVDPDNGLGNETKKHATLAEVRKLRRAGRAIVLITFPGRSTTHDLLLAKLHERLRDEADADDVVTLRTNVSVPRSEGSASFVQRQRWFTIVDPGDVLLERASGFVEALNAIPRVSAVLERTP